MNAVQRLRFSVGEIPVANTLGEILWLTLIGVFHKVGVISSQYIFLLILESTTFVLFSEYIFVFRRRLTVNTIVRLLAHT